MKTPNPKPAPAKTPAAKIEYRQLSTLKKLPNNPRTLKDDAFKKLCASIKDNADYFEARPLILSDRTGELIILAGNMRFEAAKYNGLKEAPTILLRGLSEEKEREIVVRDNVSSGQFDWDILSSEAWGTDMQLAAWDVPLPMVYNSEGFGEDFTLASGDRAPFQQMTFTLADEQAERIKGAIANVRVQQGTECGNENGNGNKLHQIVLEWAEQKK